MGIDKTMSERLASLNVVQTTQVLKLIVERKLVEVPTWCTLSIAVSKRMRLPEMVAVNTPLALPLLQDTSQRSMLALAAKSSGVVEMLDMLTVRYAVYPNDGNRTAVLTSTQFPQDLVFSIVRNLGAATTIWDSNYNLV